MPSGLTYPIMTGELTDWRKFVLSCARSFGACIMQRDADPKDPPKKREIDPSYEMAVKQAQIRLTTLEAMTPDEIKAEWSAYEKKRQEEYLKRKKEYQEIRNRYEAMRTQIADFWLPPTDDHVKLKTFMLEQLDNSMEFDCPNIERPIIKDMMEWHKECVEVAEYSLRNSTDQLKAHKKNIKEQNAWIDELYQSLK